MISWLHPLMWQLSACALLCAGIFVSGYQLGREHVEQAWGAEKLQQQTAALKQSVQVAQVQTLQERINQDIAIDHEKKKTILASHPPVLRDDALRVYVQPHISIGDVPVISESAARVDGSAPKPVSDSSRLEESVSCGQLAQDAAQTTLMVLSFQRWYAEQSKVQSQTTVP
jgi:hypothetical protein